MFSWILNTPHHESNFDRSNSLHVHQPDFHFYLWYQVWLFSLDTRRKLKVLGRSEDVQDVFSTSYLRPVPQGFSRKNKKLLLPSITISPLLLWLQESPAYLHKWQLQIRLAHFRGQKLHKSLPLSRHQSQFPFRLWLWQTCSSVDQAVDPFLLFLSNIAKRMYKTMIKIQEKISAGQ